jgi:DNA-binding winged helix-turn-helix (wHTH) protein
VAGAVYSPRLVRFGIFEVDLQVVELRKGGLKLKLSGQPFQVLAILLERPNEVVTREELQKRLWPDTFVDVDHNLNTAINKIRDALGDSAENPRFVETLARRGYRFIAPVDTRTTQPVARPRASRLTRTVEAIHPAYPLGLAGIAAVILVLVVALHGVGSRRTRLGFGGKRVESLAVLPLENLSRDPDQEYFSDGMTDALIADLSKIGALRVTSRTSSMRYKKTSKSLPEIARELNVDGVVEGSVMRSGNRCASRPD